MAKRALRKPLRRVVVIVATQVISSEIADCTRPPVVELHQLHGGGVEILLFFFQL